jgi:hypothetical protein
MLIQKSIKTLIIAGAFFILLSNSTGVPQAVSKAPGESNHNSCATCHSPGNNFNPEINIVLLDQDSNTVSQYTPGQVYTAAVTVSGTNSPRGYGFQMTCLDSLTLTDQGVWSDFGDRVRQINLRPLGNNRRYVTQSGTSSTGVFTMRWTAPAEDIGPVTFYYTGLAVNLNRTTTGDDNVFDSKTFYPATSSANSSADQPEMSLSPNPARDKIRIENMPDEARILIASPSGNVFQDRILDAQTLDISNLQSGFYIIKVIDKQNKVIHTQSFIKL